MIYEKDHPEILGMVYFFQSVLGSCKMLRPVLISLQ